MPTIGGITVPEVKRASLGSIVAAAAEGAYGQVRYGLPYQALKITGNATPEQETFYQQGLRESQAASAQAAPANTEDLFSGRVGIGRFITENLAASLPNMAGAVIGGAAGGFLGGAPGAVRGAILGGVPQFSGSNVARAVEEDGTLTEDAAKRSLAVAPFQAAADVAVGRFLPGASKFLGPLARSQTGGFLTRTAKSILEAGATEALTEAGQQVGERYAAGIPVSSADAAAEYVNAAVTAFAIGGALGVGGGFRRSAAHAKAPSEVTTDDLNESVNTILRLPSPTDVTVDAGGTARSNPNVGPQLALPSPDAFARPDGFADTAGNVAVGDEALNRLTALRDARNPTGDPGPSFADLQATIAAQQPDYGVLGAQPAAAAAPGTDLLGTTSTNALTTATRPADTAVLTDPVDVPPAPRVFAAEPYADLLAATKAKNAEPALVAEAQAEIDHRWSEARGEAATTTDNFQERVNDVKSGLRGSFVTKLEATNPGDLRNKVYTEVFENQNTASSVATLAQRIGLLDENLEPTEAADGIEQFRAAAAQIELESAGLDPNAINTASRPTARQAQARSLQARRESLAANNASEFGAAEGQTERRAIDPAEVKFLFRREGEVAPEAAAATDPVAPAAPAAPAAPSVAADPAFAQQWSQLKSQAGIERESKNLPASLKAVPANLDEARATVLRELASDRVNESGTLTQTEKLAQKLGLVSNDAYLDITPLGRRTYLSTSEGFEETTNAARDQGYSGAAASAFDRGARAAVSGETAGSFSSFEDAAAFQAGQVWADNYISTPGVVSGSVTASVQARQAKRGTVGEGRSVERAPLTPAQVSQQSLNRLLDAADLRGVSDSDIAELRRMVREGALPGDVGAALQRVQGGQTLFRERPAVRRELTTPTRRGQPIFKEMNTGEQTPSKAEARAAAEPAVQTFSLRNLVEFARAEGGVTDARAQKLHDLLDAGKTDQVKRLLKDFDPDAQPTARNRLPTPPERVDERAGGKWSGKADEALEAALTGKTFGEALDHMIEQAPSRFHRELMKQVKSLATAIEKTGFKLDLKIANPGDTVPVALTAPNTRGFAQVLRKPGTGTVWLKGTALGKDFGVNYQIVAHEMLHAVTMATIQTGETVENFGKGQIGKAAEDLTDLTRAVIRHFNAKVREGSATEFEQAVYDRSINALENEHEILAWGLTNPEMQRYLQGIEYQPRQSVFGKLVNLLRSLLGMDGKYDTALTELLRVSEQVLGVRGKELQLAYTLGRNAGLEQSVLEAPAIDGTNDTRTPAAANDVTQQVSDMAEKFAETINLADKGVKVRRALLGIISHNQLDRQFGDRAPWLLEHSDAHRARTAVRGRWENIGDAAHQSFEKLKREAPKTAAMVNDLMDRSTAFQLDPGKPFEEHEHHAKAKNKGQLKRIHTELVKVRNDLSRGDKAGITAFNEFRTLNEAQNYARLAASLHSLVAMDPELTLGVAGSEVNPMDTFMLQPDIVSSAQLRDHWQTALNRQLAAASAFVAAKRGEATTLSAADQLASRQHWSPLEMMISGTHEAIAGMAKAPYFHLGRFGDNFGSAVIRTNADGTVDLAAQAHVAEALAKAGFDDVQISADNTRPRISLRFEKVDQTRRFRAVALELQKQGWLGEDKVQAGPRNRDTNYGAADGLPAFVQDYIQRIESSAMFIADEGATKIERDALKSRQEEAVRLAVDTWLESQPDNSISKVLAKRYTVAGYNKDMVRNFAHRWNVGSVSLASVASGPKFNSAYVNGRAAINKALEADNASDPDLQSDLFSEVHRRDANAPLAAEADTFDKLRSYSHAYFLGLSPAYGMINMTQLGVTALPELAKVHGYGKSFHAMRRAGAVAFKVLKAAAAEAVAAGPAHAADVTLTESVLQKAGLSKPQLDFIRHMLATGTIDIGTSVQALGQYAKRGDEGKLANAAQVGLKYAGAIGLYTEVFSRLTTALAAQELHGGTTAESAGYATNVVSNSMFDYQNWNTARQLGKQGFAGPVTPLLTQFMSYSVQVTEKLYSEVLGAFAKPRAGESAAATAQRKAESRRFLTGHLVAVTALAGTLGLPFATVFAAALEKIVDTFDDDDDPFDVTASWRGFLADTLGKDVGEVVSRGLPRALGFDISARAGEQNLLPFSDLLSDKRSWREAVGSVTERSIGAAPSMLLNVAEGGEKLAQGDLLGGMKSMLPVAFKGPTEVYRMTEEGYVDTRGTKLPLTPQASGYLWQLLGFTPSDRAEYSEARGDQSGRRGEITRKAGQLRSQIGRALERGEDVTPLIQRVQQFDKDNPSFAVMPTLLSSIQRRAAARSTAGIARAPLGVGLNDVAGQQLTSYANVNYQ